ncbi:MAG: hypothetical protein J0M02_00740 [Planctomycetes bacterium]|nr:hypothetical protein [Planctomycetota bacterium]
MNQKLLVGALIAGLALVAINWLARPAVDVSDEEPALEDIKSLDGVQLDAALMRAIARRWYTADGNPGDWRRLGTEARSYWVVVRISRDIADVGMADWMRFHQPGTETTSPGPEDLVAALTCLGVDIAPAEAVRDAIAHPDQTADAERLRARLGKVLTDPLAVAQRQDWAKAHLAEILDR